MTDTIGAQAATHAGSMSVPTRRDLLALIGTLAGSTAMYHAMTSLGFASDSGYKGPIALAASAVVAKFLETFKEFPPSQRPATFTIDQAMEKLKQNLGGD